MYFLNLNSGIKQYVELQIEFEFKKVKLHLKEFITTFKQKKKQSL